MTTFNTPQIVASATGSTTSEVSIRSAKVDEASALHDLSIRSKAHWGYDAAFMTLTAPRLVLPEDWLRAERVFVAELSGSLAGVAAILPPDGDGTAELEHLFVDPPAMGRGVGAALLSSCLWLATTEGACKVRALADPQARPFYEGQGFRWVVDAPSDAIPGRMLPLMERML
ncbi:GNAT family N-acetyltransferase [Tabrizicola flagellatus]|uniref:GNAT family N-acetyltransferase n=1 Tax=Tabrizicola flagellatus TaxID=2593021 RepID=UPI001359D2AC|nr:GNAT family N-acetyltransferase [Tabrizicola flagellatus]